MKVCIFLALITFVSCDSNMKFNKKEMVWLNTYKTNDTLVFDSGAKRDTVLITNIEITNTYKDILASSYNPVSGTVLYKMPSSKQEEFIISITKLEPNIPTGAFFEFMGERGRIEDINNYPISILEYKRKERKGYMFKPYSKNKSSFWWNEEYGVENAKLKYFFWDKEYGIIQYETVEGDVFVLEKFIRNGEDILNL